jgi:hypothetical protein
MVRRRVTTGLRRRPPLESQIQAAILRAVAYRRDVYAWRNNSGALPNERGRPIFFGKRGSADILGVVRGGRFLALECKRPGEKPTPKQLPFGAAVEAQGGVYAVVTSVDEALAVVDAAIAGRAA